MARQPFNLNIHISLTELGYELIVHEDESFDGGDAENGPDFDYCPAFDEYMSADDVIIIDQRGNFVHYEVRDLAMEAWCDQQLEVSNFGYRL